MWTSTKEESSERRTETSRQRLVSLKQSYHLIDQNMIVGTLVNSMLSYMSVFHFEEAMKCADFILDQYLKDPEIYYRKA
jgi:hypothetical protein